MAIGNVIPFSQGIAKIVTLAQLQNRDVWERAFQNKCKDHRYYEIVDETLEGDFEHHYLVLKDDPSNVRAVQPVFFVRQNLVEGVPGRLRSVVDLVRKTFPRFLTMRVLMVGCVAGAGDLGACDEKDETWIAAALLASLRNYARQNKASLIVLKDFPAKYRLALEPFRSNGYARIPSMPMTRLVLHYQTWDEKIIFVRLDKECRNGRVSLSGGKTEKLLRSVFVWCATMRSMMNASGLITASRSICTFISTRCATSSRGRSNRD